MPKTFQLKKPGLAVEVETRFQRGGSRREMERLMALRMALSGEYTLEQIARAVGRARSRIGEWMKVARGEGLAALLERHQGRGRAPQVTGKALTGLRHGLQRGRWTRAKDTAVWLEQRHGIRLTVSGMRYWLKKAGES